jgi:hypothetical protein
MNGMNEPGTYEITVGEDTHTVDADYIEQTDNGEVRVWKDGNTVAVFNWWSSIVKKP